MDQSGLLWSPTRSYISWEVFIAYSLKGLCRVWVDAVTTVSNGRKTRITSFSYTVCLLIKVDVISTGADWKTVTVAETRRYAAYVRGRIAPGGCRLYQRCPSYRHILPNYVWVPATVAKCCQMSHHILFCSLAKQDCALQRGCPSSGVAMEKKRKKKTESTQTPAADLTGQTCILARLNICCHNITYEER